MTVLTTPKWITPGDEKSLLLLKEHVDQTQGRSINAIEDGLNIFRFNGVVPFNKKKNDDYYDDDDYDDDDYDDDDYDDDDYDDDDYDDDDYDDDDYDDDDYDDDDYDDDYEDDYDDEYEDEEDDDVYKKRHR
jgi:hypothetical protein